MKPALYPVLFGGGIGAPSLDLDFTKITAETWDNRVTFSRGSTATRVGPTGLIETVASGVPRIDYDPVTLACRGLLIEEQRSNRLSWSEDFSNAVWVKTNATVTANAVASPSGATDADTLTATAGNATVVQSITPGAGSQTQSIYLKRKTGTGNVDVTADGATWVTQTLSSTEWTRCVVTQTCGASALSVGVRIVTSGDAVYAWGAQHE